jgi:hypothetical protein
MAKEQYMQLNIKIEPKTKVKDVPCGKMFVYQNKLYTLLRHSRDEDDKTSLVQQLAYIGLNGWQGHVEEVRATGMDEENLVEIVQGIF